MVRERGFGWCKTWWNAWLLWSFELLFFFGEKHANILIFILGWGRSGSVGVVWGCPDGRLSAIGR